MKWIDLLPGDLVFSKVDSTNIFMIITKPIMTVDSISWLQFKVNVKRRTGISHASTRTVKNLFVNHGYVKDRITNFYFICRNGNLINDQKI